MSSTSLQLSEADLDRWMALRQEQVAGYAKTNFLAYIKTMTPDFRINWHHRVIANALEKFARGEILRLMIFLQPQIGKSEMVSRHFPGFLFGHDPDLRVIAGTYGDTFASLFNLDVQRIMDSEPYRKLFPNAPLAGHGEDGQWIKNSSLFDIVGHRGRYHSVGVGGSLTGKTGNVLLIDDPVKNDEEARSKIYREKQFNWYNTVARTRLKKSSRDGIPPRVLLTMTRWHEDDLAGRLLALAKANPKLPQWTILKFPAIREDMENPYDPRELDGPLWPEMVSMAELEELKADRRTWTSLYQQRPSPESGTVVKREWWKFYRELPADMDIEIQSWDLTFKDGEKNDFVAGQVWGKKGANKYLIYRFKGRLAFNEQLSVFKQVTAKFPRAGTKLVEDTANGPALIAALKNEISGIIAIKPKGSKLARAESVAPEVEAGNVYLPDPSIDPNIGDFIEEWSTFPNGVHDDEVDACSQALNRLKAQDFMDWSPISIQKLSTWNG